MTKKKLRVLHVANHFWPCRGGIEKVMEDLCVGLRKQGVTADVLCLNKCSNAPQKLKAGERHRGITVHRMDFLDLKYYKFAIPELDLIKRYDVVHVHGLGFLLDWLVLTKPLHQKPIILHTHGGIFHTKKMMALKNAYFDVWAKRMLKGVDKIIAVSQNDAKLFGRITPKGKIALMENGIDYADFHSIKRKKHSGTNFIFVGRLSKNKRVDWLIKAFHEFKKMNPRQAFNVFIVGNDWEGLRKGLVELRDRLDLKKEIGFLGAQTDAQLRALYAKSDFLVSASSYEGFGITVLEASAAGLVPIVNDIDSFNYLINDGSNGFIVDYMKPKESAQKINAIMKNKSLKSIRGKAIENAARFDWQKKVNQLISIYEGLA